LDDGHEISRAIEHSPIQVTCLVDGKSASMGMYILESCDQRLMTKRSMLMIHQVALMVGRGARLTETSLENASATIKVATRAYVEWVTHRMKIKAPEVLQKINSGREWWLDWQDAIKFGAVDKVVEGPPEAVLKNLKKNGTP
jgi:ATP-dependent protease ClpP protease subunit